MKRLFIVNPLSERVSRKGSVLAKLAISDVKTIKLDPFNVIIDEVSQAAKDKIEHVVIEGGDGTVQGVISEFLRQENSFENFPYFSIIPGGMTNQVCKNIGFKSARRNYVAKRLSTTLVESPFPLLMVADEEGVQYAGFLFSTGAMPQITRYTTSKLHTKGVGGTLAVIGGIVKGIRGDDATLMQTSDIEIEDVYKGDHLGTILTTLPSLIIGLDPFWGKGNAPLRLTWASADYQKLGRNIISLWRGKKSKDRSDDGLYSMRCEQLDITYSGPVVLDGEFLSFPTNKFTIRPSRPVTFLR